MSHERLTPEPFDEALIQVFDGHQPELAENDKNIAAITFSQLVHATLTAHEYATSRSDRTGAMYFDTWLEADMDSAQWIILTTRWEYINTVQGFGKKSCEIKLIKTDSHAGELAGPSFCYYILNGEDWVRRHDSSSDSDVSDRLRVEYKDLHHPTAEEVSTALHRLHFWQPNNELEERLGLNDQPVGMREVQNIANLVAVAVDPNQPPSA